MDAVTFCFQSPVRSTVELPTPMRTSRLRRVMPLKLSVEFPAPISTVTSNGTALFKCKFQVYFTPPIVVRDAVLNCAVEQLRRAAGKFQFAGSDFQVHADGFCRAQRYGDRFRLNSPHVFQRPRSADDAAGNAQRQHNGASER